MLITHLHYNLTAITATLAEKEKVHSRQKKIATHNKAYFARTHFKCTALEVPGAASYAVILNRPIGIWGADSGANEKKLSVAVSWSREAADADIKLTAADLTRYRRLRHGLNRRNDQPMHLCRPSD